jgi:UDP-glucose 4-epimerase
MANILVVREYIGAHTCLDLFNKGFTPIVYDNLSNGHAEFVKWGPLEVGDIRDRGSLDEVPRRSFILQLLSKLASRFGIRATTMKTTSPER